ncbi:MAG: hypothetical protein WCF60_16325 [Anaerobacillus sp.]
MTIHLRLTDDMVIYFQQATTYWLPSVSLSPSLVSPGETEVLQHPAHGQSTK